MKAISIDIETFSSVDLGKSGVYRYAEGEDFEVLLFGYSIDGGEVQVIDLTCGEKIPPVIISALSDPTITKWAFNAQFERICLSRFLGFPTGTYLDPTGWHCTMVYLCFETWEQIAVDMDYSIQHIYRIRDKALSKISIPA